MSEILARLEREHRNFARLLDLLDGQLARLGRGEDADFRLMSDIMRYVGVYPEMVHLPTEALVVRCLIDRDATQARIGASFSPSTISCAGSGMPSTTSCKASWAAPSYRSIGSVPSATNIWISAVGMPAWGRERSSRVPGRC